MNWTEFPTKSTQWPNVTFKIHQIRTKLRCFNSIYQICGNEAASAICTFHISAAAAVHVDRRTSRCGRQMCPTVLTNDLYILTGTYINVPGWYLRNSWKVADLDHLCFYTFNEHEYNVYLHVNYTQFWKRQHGDS